jgi:hypothetical protein
MQKISVTVSSYDFDDRSSSVRFSVRSDEMGSAVERNLGADLFIRSPKSSIIKNATETHPSAKLGKAESLLSQLKSSVFRKQGFVTSASLTEGLTTTQSLTAIEVISKPVDVTSNAEISRPDSHASNAMITKLENHAPNERITKPESVTSNAVKTKKKRALIQMW